MRPGIGKCGMETATSMILLLIAAALIFSFLHFHTEIEPQVDDLFDLRVRQARSLYDVLTTFVPDGCDCALSDLVGEKEIPFFLVWDGSSVRNTSSGNVTLIESFSAVLHYAPDDLPALLVITGGSPIQDTGDRPAAVWMGETERGAELTVSLPLHKGEIPVVGGLMV